MEPVSWWHSERALASIAESRAPWGHRGEAASPGETETESRRWSRGNTDRSGSLGTLTFGVSL